jgi:hypothetical protein
VVTPAGVVPAGATDVGERRGAAGAGDPGAAVTADPGAVVVALTTERHVAAGSAEPRGGGSLGKPAPSTKCQPSASSARARFPVGPTDAYDQLPPLPSQYDQ